MATPTCSIQGCDKPKWARGWCGTHYQRWRTTGDVGGAELLLAKPKGRCSVDGCRKPAHYGLAQLCKGHYLRRMRHGSVTGGSSSPQFDARCRIRSCEKRHYSRGLCQQHWATVQSHPAERATRRGFPIIGSLTVDALIARVDYYGGLCWMCGAPADEIDHVKPLSAGGAWWPSNLRPACHDCNARKRNVWPYPTTTRKAA